MTAHKASLINAIVLIVVSIVSFVGSGMASYTALIPLVFGAALIACYSGVKSENKVISHIAVALTLIVLVALFMPLMGAVNRGDGLAIARIAVMWGSTAFAMVFFVKSFIDARKKRA